MIETVEDTDMANSEKAKTVVAARFLYTENGRWHSIDVSCAELLSIMQLGMVDGKQICKLEIFTVTNEDEEKIAFVYDFVALGLGNNPWRIE